MKPITFIKKVQSSVRGIIFYRDEPAFSFLKSVHFHNNRSVISSNIHTPYRIGVSLLFHKKILSFIFEYQPYKPF